MATILEKRAPERTPQAPATPPVGRGLRVVVALAIAAVAVAATVTLWPSGGAPPAEQEQPAIDSGTGLYTEAEEEIMRLVAQGLIPAETLEGGTFLLKRLINRGLVPEQALKPYVPRVEPLWCPEDHAMMAAVANGLIPREVLEGEPFRTKRLINQGLIPRQAVEPC